MTESALDFFAIMFELGTPAVLAFVAFHEPKTRAKVASIFGAVSPFLLAYAATTVQWLVSDRSPEASFGLYAMWGMSFFVYLLSLGVGIALAFLRKPKTVLARFFVSFFAAPAVVYVLILVESAA